MDERREELVERKEVETKERREEKECEWEVADIQDDNDAEQQGESERGICDNPNRVPTRSHNIAARRR